MRTAEESMFGSVRRRRTVTRLNGGQKDERKERGGEEERDEQPRAVRGRSVYRRYFMAR